ncbi:TIGR00266 family protein [Candidatus Electronema sp. TJ]|uniref:TIGR00266 family protein n=1 Tax=Candidatus Electronema sp. TJ TaxID=3401573 RepID=UPI003AA88C90
MYSWHVAVNGQTAGPYSHQQLLAGLRSGQFSRATLVWREGFSDWQAIENVPELADPGSAAAQMPPPVTGRHAHEIDYEIFGHEMQFVEIELDPQESVIAEAGSMMHMTDGIRMDTVFGDGSASSQSGGLFDKMLGAGKRLITGESLFMTVFTQTGSGKGRAAFAAPYPGKIIPLDLSTYGGRIICQKDAFLCAAKGVSVGIAFQKKIGVALFGGEGFIMQRLDGDGLCFVHAGGTIVERQLEAGQSLRVDTGCLVALTQTVQYDIEFVGNVKSAVFGGEGFFFATLRGPGHVWLQSLPFSRLAGRIWAAAPQAGGKGGDEGSVIGGLANLFEK